MSSISKPKYMKTIENYVYDKLKETKKPNNDLIQSNQIYIDQVLEIYREAFKNIINHTITYSLLLNDIRSAYENALYIRDKRISQFIIQDVKCEYVGLSRWQRKQYIMILKERLFLKHYNEK